jgi:hypothetical protein
VTPLTTLRTRLVGVGAAFGLAATLAACGGGSTAATTVAAGATATGTAAGQPTGAQGTRGGLDAAMQTKIRQCLAAAGIAMPTFTRPSNMPSGQRPSGSPRPSGASGSPRAGGGFGGMFSDAKTKAALQACGITLPTRPAGSGGAAPTGSPTS